MRLAPHNFGESVLLAVSGGADSMVMADMVIRTAIPAISHDRIVIAHCNFHLRGEESDGDASFVRSWAAKWGVRFEQADFDTAAAASQWGVSIEMAARRLRYEWFDSLCHQYGCRGVCVAHNANDNAETLILNLVRGTGLKGLCGMQQESKNAFGDSLVFRPMLEFSREQIEKYAERNGVEFRTDSSNLESEYKRNLVRNEVMPLLRRLNPSVLDTFTEDMRHLRQAQEIVEDWVAGLPAPLLKEPLPSKDGPLPLSEGGYQTFRRGLAVPPHIIIPELLALPHWEYLLYSKLSALGFSSAVVGQVERLLKDPEATLSGHRFESPRYLLVTTTKELVLSPRPDAAGAGSTTKSKIIEPRVELLDWCSSMDVHTPKGVLLVDAAKVAGLPRFRLWKEGDWFRPLGMRGKKKVSDFLTDLKYNILQKENVLVLEGEGSHVLAVLGERIDESLKITPETTKVYRISIS